VVFHDGASTDPGMYFASEWAVDNMGGIKETPIVDHFKFKMDSNQIVAKLISRQCVKEVVIDQI
jgi:hypothetical protein